MSTVQGLTIDSVGSYQLSFLCFNEEIIVMDNRPIGFLDSGVGGLTVVSELMRQLPMKKSFILVIQQELLMVLDLLNKSENIPGSWFVFY